VTDTLYSIQLKNDTHTVKAKHASVDATTPPESCRQRQMFPATGKKKKT